MRLESRPHGQAAASRALQTAACLLPLLLALSGSPIAAESVRPDADDPCFDSLAGVHQAPLKLSEDAVARFLRSVHSGDCQSDLEFEAWSTETLFDLMQDTPETFFRVLMKASPSVQASVITALDNPADEFIDYSAIYESITTGVRDKRLRDYALRIFTPHYQRHLKEQKAWERLDRPTGKAQPG